ncbi:MAG: hypothetical protein V1725_07200 [archaeon]
MDVHTTFPWQLLDEKKTASFTIAHDGHKPARIELSSAVEDAQKGLKLIVPRIIAAQFEDRNFPEGKGHLAYHDWFRQGYPGIMLTDSAHIVWGIRTFPDSAKYKEQYHRANVLHLTPQTGFRADYWFQKNNEFLFAIAAEFNPLRPETSIMPIPFIKIMDNLDEETLAKHGPVSEDIISIISALPDCLSKPLLPLLQYAKAIH